jgi:hypothetical protein
MLVMSEYALRVRDAASLMAGWIACAMITICGPLPGSAAERIVLCEDFTDYW